MYRKSVTFLLSCLLSLFITSNVNGQIPVPEDYFGYKPGSDGNLFNYEELIAYLQKVDELSDRLEMRKVGTSPMGKPMYIAFFSLPENIARLDEFKGINKELAINPQLDEEEKEGMIKNGKVFVMATLSMHSTGTRYFVPPNHDPIAMNVDEGIWNWTGIFGANVIKDMTREDLSGVSQHYLFDDYWPGSTETCIWKNVIGFLTECASAKYATPVYVEPTELSVRGKGLSEYKKSINMPDPWPGGWWRLSDIVEYEIVSVESILKTAVHI